MIRYGDAGPAVAEVQGLLQRAAVGLVGAYRDAAKVHPGDADGIYGSRTESAHEHYKAFYGIGGQRNVISDATVDHLRRAWAAGSCGAITVSPPEEPAPAAPSLSMLKLVESLPSTAEHWGEDRGDVHCIDISGHQSEVELREVAAAGISLVTVKATENDGYLHKRVGWLLEEVRALGMSAQTYHYLRPDDLDVSREVGHFLRTVERTRAFVPGDFGPMMDFEKGAKKPADFDGDGKPETAHDFNVLSALHWLEGVERALGVTPMVYLTRPAWGHYGYRASKELLERLSRFPLMWTDYPRKAGKITADIRLTSAFGHEDWREAANLPWRIHGRQAPVWQWTGKGRVPGIGRGKRDCDRSFMRREFFEAVTGRRLAA